MIIMNRGVLYCIGLCLVIVVLFASNLLLGSVSIPAEDVMRILLGDPNEKASWRFYRRFSVIRWQVRVSSVSTAVRV